MSNATLDKVQRILTVATGESYGDGMTVTDVIVGYAEPGYGDADSVVVLGNWNPARFPGEGDAPLTRAENLGPRLADALERVGAEVQWLDEWSSCQDCFRAVRTQADSYSWRPSYVFLEDAGPVCSDCLIAMGADALEQYVNNADTAVTWCDASHLESLGFTQWEANDPHTYESGWHPGQTDDPHAILEQIRRVDDIDVVFFLDESSQFYIRFSAYTRDETSDQD